MKKHWVVKGMKRGTYWGTDMKGLLVVPPVVEKAPRPVWAKFLVRTVVVTVVVLGGAFLVGVLVRLLFQKDVHWYKGVIIGAIRKGSPFLLDVHRRTLRGMEVLYARC